MRRFAISGATGFLGSQVVGALLARGDRVAVLTRDTVGLGSSRLAALTERLEALPLTEAGMESALAGGIDAVIHCAASYGRRGESPAELVATNVHLPLRLAGVCGTRIDRWLAIGSGLPREVSPYALSKAQAADWLRILPAAAFAPRVHLAVQQFYGPGDDASKLPTLLARKCLEDAEVSLTSGIQVRDFLHVTDVVGAILVLLDAPVSGAFLDVPVGSGVGITVRDFAERVQQAAGGRGKLRFGAVPARAGEPAACVADPTVLRSLGWNPRIALEQGITGLVAAERMLLQGHVSLNQDRSS